MKGVDSDEDMDSQYRIAELDEVRFEVRGVRHARGARTHTKNCHGNEGLRSPNRRNAPVVSSVRVGDSRYYGLIAQIKELFHKQLIIV